MPPEPVLQPPARGRSSAPRALAAAIAFALLGAACASGSSSNTTTATSSAPDIETESQVPADDNPPAAGGDEADADTLPDNVWPEEDEPADTAAAVDAPADEAVAEDPPAEDPPAEPAGENNLPVVAVRDVATGLEVNLASYAPAELPIVLWFYAPH